MTGHSAMALYRHFKSMDHLHALLWNECFDLVHGQMDEACSGTDSPLTALRCRFRAFLSFSKEHPNLFWNMISRRPGPETFGEPNAGDRGFARWQQIYQEGIDQGAFRPTLDPLRAALKTAYILLGSASFLASQSTGVGGMSPTDLMDEAVEIVTSEALSC